MAWISLSIVQMPTGIPVADCRGNAGASNAALLALEILELVMKNKTAAKDYRQKMHDEAKESSAELD